MIGAGVCRLCSYTALDVPKMECFICLDACGVLQRKGCACRGSGAVVHVECMVRVVDAQLPHRGELAWYECQTCGQSFTGTLCVALADAWLARAQQGTKERQRALNYRAHSIGGMGSFAEAEGIYREVLAVRLRTKGKTHKSTLISMSKLASVLGDQDKHAEAEPLHRAVLMARTVALGAHHELTLSTKSNLARSLSAQGKYDESATLFEQVIEAQTSVLGADHGHTLVAMSNYASMLTRRGNNEEAERTYRATLAAHWRVFGDSHPNTLTIEANLAFCLMQQGKHDEAAAIYERTIPEMRLVLGAEHPGVKAIAREAKKCRSDCQEKSVLCRPPAPCSIYLCPRQLRSIVRERVRPCRRRRCGG
jgi:Flp pilus assembly protein TadD